MKRHCSLALLLLCLLACGGGGSGTSSGIDGATLAGNWSGTGSSTMGYGTHPYSASLTDEAGTIGGTVTENGVTIDVVGTRSGTSFSFAGTWPAGNRIEFDGTLTGSTMSGTYGSRSIYDGSLQDEGSFLAMRS